MVQGFHGTLRLLWMFEIGVLGRVTKLTPSWGATGATGQVVLAAFVFSIAMLEWLACLVGPMPCWECNWEMCC